MDVALVHNTKAGGADVSRKRIEAALRKNGFRPRYFTLGRALNDPSAFDFGDFVVVAGGDGSIRKAALKMIGRNRVLAPLPVGTANNIANSLGIKGSIEKICSGWRNGRPRAVDIGVADGPWGKSYFFEGVGLGLLGRAMPIIREIDEASGHVFPTPEDKLHRDLCVFIALAQELAPVRLGLSLDGVRVKMNDYLLLEVLNIARSGPRLELVPVSEPDDGYFNVVAALEADRAKLKRALKKHLTVAQPGPILQRRRAHRVRMKLSEGTLRLDDRIIWTGGRRSKAITVDISLIPGALKVLVPAVAGT